VGAAGGLGHLGIQYAKAMGMRVIALDVGEKSRQYCLSLGAEFAYDVTTPGYIEEVNTITAGGGHGVLCLATSPKAFAASIQMARRKGTVVCVGLPAGGFDTPIFEVVLKRITIRGSIVGTRKDLVETLDIASRGLVKCSVELGNIENINEIFDRLRGGQINWRVVLDISGDCLECGQSHQK